MDSALGATAAHKAPERMADGTCIQVGTWMTNKCRKRMNERWGYITSEISQVKKGEKREEGKKVPGKWGELGIHILGRGVLSLWDVGPSDLVFFAPIWSSPIPEQAVVPSKPNFWTHSLQIHCNGSAGPRSRLSLGPVKKSWPYKYPQKKKKTLVSLKNKSCSLDLEQKELLVMTNRALIFLPQIIGLMALFIVEMQPKTKKGIRQKQN